MKRQVKKIVPNAHINACRTPETALELAKTEGCDVLLTAIDLARIHTDGFMLAKKIQRIYPRVNVILITDHESNEEALAAWQIYASGYVKRPYDKQRMVEEFANLRYKVST